MSAIIRAQVAALAVILEGLSAHPSLTRFSNVCRPSGTVCDHKALCLGGPDGC